MGILFPHSLLGTGKLGLRISTVGHRAQDVGMPAESQTPRPYLWKSSANCGRLLPRRLPRSNRSL